MNPFTTETDIVTISTGQTACNYYTQIAKDLEKAQPIGEDASQDFYEKRI